MKKGYSKLVLNLLLIFTVVPLILFRESICYGHQCNNYFKGQSVTLRVNVPGAVSYQWSKDGQAITGATNNSYTVSVSVFIQLLLLTRRVAPHRHRMLLRLRYRKCG